MRRRALGLNADRRVDVRSVNDFDSAFAAMMQRARRRVHDDCRPSSHATHQAGHRLPGGATGCRRIFRMRTMSYAGGLMSYGPSLPDLFRRGADYVDKILQGSQARATCRWSSRPSSSWSSTSRPPRRSASTIPPIAARARRRGDRVRAARVHHAARRRGGGVAARGARAAAGDAGDRVPQRRIA